MNTKTPRVMLLTPITFDPESVRQLGLVSAYFSVFESYIDVLIWNLLELGDTETGLSVTARMDAKRKIELFSRLVSLKVVDEKEKSAARELLRNCFDLCRDRNAVIHANWIAYSISKKVAIAVRHQVASELKTTAKEYRSDDIADIAQQALLVIDQIRKFFELKFGETLPGNMQFLK